ncbi:hypothetical protein CsSME_00014258 [Camellia sinensis var. sinensis]
MYELVSLPTILKLKRLSTTAEPYKDSWKAELKEFSSNNGYDLNKNGDSAPLLLDVLEGFLKYELCYIVLHYLPTCLNCKERIKQLRREG